MHLLTELSSVFTEADDTIAKIGKKGKKINDECSNIVDDAEGYLIYIGQVEKHQVL